MAKRFTETGKWDKAWFRKLSPKMKCVREFLQDKCDHAGFWEIDMETISHFVNEKIELQEILDSFPDRVKLYKNTKLWYIGFIEFQYGELKENYNPHKPAVKILKKLNLWPRVHEDLGNPSPRVMDKYKDKDKDKENRGSVRGINFEFHDALFKFWNSLGIIKHRVDENNFKKRSYSAGSGISGSLHPTIYRSGLSARSTALPNTSVST